MDRLESVERYSYFGSFRSDISNVGHNAAMLTQDGELTDIGSWYLGKAATGNIPKASAAIGRLRITKWGVGSIAIVAGLWIM